MRRSNREWVESEDLVQQFKKRKVVDSTNYALSSGFNQDTWINDNNCNVLSNATVYHPDFKMASTEHNQSNGNLVFSQNQQISNNQICIHHNIANTQCFHNIFKILVIIMLMN